MKKLNDCFLNLLLIIVVKLLLKWKREIKEDQCISGEVTKDDYSKSSFM